jgi:hypothetical protein
MDLLLERSASPRSSRTDEKRSFRTLLRLINFTGFLEMVVLEAFGPMTVRPRTGLSMSSFGAENGLVTRSLNKMSGSARSIIVAYPGPPCMEG